MKMVVLKQTNTLANLANQKLKLLFLIIKKKKSNNIEYA